ncbi:glycosyltransferase family 4 protein [Methylocystis sp. Sn-Cys]|uniref:glycosyltransferase family 4 protein n=1 Tax=Methylocystis sp. Sn-Cys TaxID=1701263 RepID=UPI00192066F4|nr:glycosyltransferase family 4 protein [Methylocystis sp. Sn-Cys]MBL1256080.1 glycosyltransferase family 4 protein [Methylocystis sp. Sn-Cys]
MDIVVAHDFYQQRGGEDQCVEDEVKMLRSHGHNVIEYFVHNDSLEGMPPLTLAANTIWSRQAFNDLGAIVRDRRPQVVHFHNTLPLISPSAYYATKQHGAAVVQTLHNYRLLCPNGLFFRQGRVCEDCCGKMVPWPAIKNKCYRANRAATATISGMLAIHKLAGTWRSAVDMYIALSEFGRRKLVAGGFPASRVATKPNFLARDAQPGPGRGGYVIYAGRLSSEKGVDLLLEAWGALGREVPLKIIGDGPMAGRVKDACSQEPAIEWLGQLDIEAVYELVGDADALIVPSRCYENFPRVIVEAFGKGTPVIAPGFGPIVEIIENGVTGLLFRPGDASDLAQKVRGMMADGVARAHMRRAAYRAYADNFTEDANHKSLMRIYERAIATADAGKSRRRQSIRVYAETRQKTPQ